MKHRWKDPATIRINAAEEKSHCEKENIDTRFPLIVGKQILPEEEKGHHRVFCEMPHFIHIENRRILLNFLDWKLRFCFSEEKNASECCEECYII